MPETYNISVDTSNCTYPSGDWWWTSPNNTYWTTTTYTNTVYLYQLICPRCKTTNWGEVDKVVVCKGELPARIRGRKVYKDKCEAKLKAVSQQVDFEVPVG